MVGCWGGGVVGWWGGRVVGCVGRRRICTIPETLIKAIQGPQP